MRKLVPILLFVIPIAMNAQCNNIPDDPINKQFDKLINEGDL